jgi:hypothetical protein
LLPGNGLWLRSAGENALFEEDFATQEQGLRQPRLLPVIALPGSKSRNWKAGFGRNLKLPGYVKQLVGSGPNPIFTDYSSWFDKVLEVRARLNSP